MIPIHTSGELLFSTKWMDILQYLQTLYQSKRTSLLSRDIIFISPAENKLLHLIGWYIKPTHHTAQPKFINKIDDMNVFRFISQCFLFFLLKFNIISYESCVRCKNFPISTRGRVAQASVRTVALPFYLWFEKEWRLRVIQLGIMCSQSLTYEKKMKMKINQSK